MGTNKISPHIIDFNNDVLEFIRLAQPDYAKVMVPQGHNDMKLARAKELSPHTKWICRLYRDNQSLNAPRYNAQLHARLMEPYKDSYDIYEGYNEPPPYDPDDWKRLNEFEVELARIVHGWGKKYCAFNWSNGQPPHEAWAHLIDATRGADYIGIHSYGWPTLSDCEDLVLRHRDLPQLGKPILLTEFGFTELVANPSAEDVGWRTWDIHPWAARQYRCIEQLAWMADRLAEDNNVLAACYFVTGRLQGDQWRTHDLTPAIYRKIAGYVAQPNNSNGGNNMKTDSPLATWREGVPPVNYTLGLAKKTKIVLHSTDGTFTQAVNWFLDPDSKVSAHYVIGRGHAGEPKIYQMVREKDIAHHAGSWDMNEKSIGIECADDKLTYLTDGQERRLVDLLRDIVKRYPHIGPDDIILHREVVATECPQAISGDERDCIVTCVFGGAEPTPDWEAKYKQLRIRVDEVSGLTTQIQLDLDRIINEDFRDLSRLREAIDKLLE